MVGPYIPASLADNKPTGYWLAGIPRIFFVLLGVLLYAFGFNSDKGIKEKDG